ncbi:helix-turn-helix transcriptional regulator [Pseudomonas aeruginosa]|uniref:AraC family transcriptional regulator n=1 Tax=Pseudomonas aeruginosa TaxID=287 RepID=UPI00073DF057|nr:helix-turn-helix transcriptional regulator [Pseudomonas aeruginosa]ALV80270.1 HTH-type transcriptional repressor of iron proteins A [Pseudomonas aeruginosa]EKW0330713.1 helix-turn-helix transcriptional regulator [Pseudomonas aeruginosa]EKW2707859.1 helix-turn-helix transcriptional regulator [Pseudomonas aeruginosa]EKW3861047.1 helix-turn-helix transcriptional regulator [Pseudomonas aeruginosa]MBC9043427.1 helix-turn-helix transcriptional regulator [Pseudomonas aeruginosa]
MPASKPVADPARSTDPRDYQRVGRPLGVMAKTFPAGFVVAEHRHERAQLIHALSGVIELHVGRTLWLVPPQRAVWMPAGMAHAMLARGEVRLHTVYVRPQSCPPEFPRVPRGVMVSPLLRELIVRAAGLPLLYDERGREGRLMAVLLDELEWSREQPLALPDPGDRRLGRVCQALLENPADPRGLEEWARYVGASSRTLARLFLSELGVTFVHWRHQVRLAAALPRLAAGEAVARIAVDLGYQTPSAFSAMFRRLTGSTPSRYFALSDSA